MVADTLATKKYGVSIEVYFFTYVPGDWIRDLDRVACSVYIISQDAILDTSCNTMSWRHGGEWDDDQCTHTPSGSDAK